MSLCFIPGHKTRFPNRIARATPEFFKRQITITPLMFDDGGAVNPNLLQIAVIVSYKVRNAWRTCTLTTYVSSVLMIKKSAQSVRGRASASAQAGYSMVELLIAMGITTAIMGATLGGLSNVMRSNDMVVRVTSMNNGLRAGMDLMIGDLLQAGAGLPKGHVISTPSDQTAVRVVGNLATLNAQAPTGAAAPAATRITRIRMISYYLDNTTSPGRPRLVRRINNGHETGFSNLLGTAVALDIEDLRFTYDLTDGATNSTNAYDYWPNALYDAREGNYRPAGGTTGVTTASLMNLGGVINYVSLDVSNLKKWLAGTIGTTGIPR